MPKAIMRIIEIIKKRTRDVWLRIIVHHTNAAESAAILADKIKEQIDCKELYIRFYCSDGCAYRARIGGGVV